MPHRSSFPSNSLSLSNHSIHSSTSGNPHRLSSKASISSQTLHSIKGRLQGLEGLARGPRIRSRQWTAMLFTSEQTVSILSRSRCSSALPRLALKSCSLCAVPFLSTLHQLHHTSLPARFNSWWFCCHVVHWHTSLSIIPAPWRMLSTDNVKSHLGMPKNYMTTSCILSELHTAIHSHAPVTGAAHTLSSPPGHGSLQPHLQT